MIGFDLDESLKDLRKNLLKDYKIFTGEAKPNAVRLLPALNIDREIVEMFISGFVNCQRSMVNAEKISIS